jgi:hypothetical protein
MKTEAERIKSNQMGEMPDGLGWIYEIPTGENQAYLLGRVVQIVGAIAQSDRQNWPNDDEWRSLLPAWFTDSFTILTREEAQQLLMTTPKESWSQLPWMFGAWLDAIRDRGWQWWSAQKGPDYLRICLSIHEWPAHLEAFENIVRAAGGEPISRTQWQTP